MPLVLTLLAGPLVVAAAVAIPLWTGWDVHTRNSAPDGLAPWHGWWEPHLGPGTLPAILLAVLAVWGGRNAADRWSWRSLTIGSWLASAAWLLSLALVDGTSGLSRALGNPHEYLRTARDVTQIGPLLAGWVDRIPLDSAGHWPIHVAGHPPGMLLFFVVLVRIGLGGDLAAGVTVALLASTIAPAVLITARRLGSEPVARSAAPFLVFTPAGVYLAVSADAVMAVVGAWAVAALAGAATARRRRATTGWAALAGLLFGLLVLMSYGLVLFAATAIGLVVGTRSNRVLLPCGLTAAAVVLAPGWAGFWWPEAFLVLRDRYWDGLAASRPGTYWTWANLALLTTTAGPVVVAALTRIRRLPRPILGIVAGTITAVLVADASQMSRAEVERIWLPFVPWLTLAAAALPARWVKPAVASQVLLALALQHLLYTSW